MLSCVIKTHFEFFFTLYVFSELHDAVFVVGALEETIVLRGMRYHPIDIENTVMRCHQKIAEWYAYDKPNLHTTFSE